MAIYKRGEYYWMDFIRADGKRIRKTTGTQDKRQAQELHDKLKSEGWKVVHLGAKPRYTWQEAVVRYISEQKEKKSLITDIYWLRWIDTQLKDAYLDEINRMTLENIKAERLKTGVTNATVNRTLTTIRKILRVAVVQWEWLDSVPNVKMLPEPKERVRWLTVEEANTLIANLPDHLALMVRFSLATGLRESNVTQLQWSQVDMQRRCAWVHAHQAKAGKAIAVPLNDDALSVIRSQIGKHPDFVFTYKNKPVKKAHYKAFNDALKKSGIDNFRWHDLRHTWASWHVQNGTPLQVLKELGGWADLTMVLRYAHLSSDHLIRFAQNSKIEINGTNLSQTKNKVIGKIA